LAFHWRAAASSWSSSVPWASSATGCSRSPLATDHWYQVRSQATVIRAASALPAAAPIETRGSPRVRVRPATVRAAALALNRVTARSKVSAAAAIKPAAGGT